MNLEILFRYVLSITILTTSSCNNSNGIHIVKKLDKNQKLLKEYLVNDLGKKNGWYKEYYSNGTTMYIHNYSNDSLEGEQKVFYNTGKIAQISFCKNSQLDSIQRGYYPNGKIMKEYFWITGKRFGVQKEFDSLGKINYQYFIPLHNDSSTSSITFNSNGMINEKEGNLIYCVYSNIKVKKDDTVKIVFIL